MADENAIVRVAAVSCVMKFLVSYFMRQKAMVVGETCFVVVGDTGHDDGWLELAHWEAMRALGKPSELTQPSCNWKRHMYLISKERMGLSHA